MKNDDYRLARIAEIARQLLDVVEKRGITRDSLLSDVETQWLVTTPLFNIGEQVNCLSAEVTDAYPNVPWLQVAGLRHRLAHHYEGTNWGTIASVLFDELEPFANQVDEIIAQRNGSASAADSKETEMSE